MRCGLLLIPVLCLCACRPAATSPEPFLASTTALTGMVTTRGGEPAPDAFVYAYRSARGSTRGPADFGIRTGDDGRYLLELPPGRYLLIARQGRGGEASGPPRAGESWALFRGNPVVVGSGEVERAHFTLRSSARPPRMKAGSLLEGETGFTGRLVDAEGRAVSGAFALAYGDRDFHRMPEFTSLPANERGRFTLYVPQAGTFCLAARTRTRGQPVTGEPYGLLGGGGGPCRSVSEGEILDIGTVTMRPYRR